jgi:hypothetical protein
MGGWVGGICSRESSSVMGRWKLPIASIQQPIWSQLTQVAPVTQGSVTPYGDRPTLRATMRGG